jgi:hypothetical protein
MFGEYLQFLETGNLDTWNPQFLWRISHGPDIRNLQFLLAGCRTVVLHAARYGFCNTTCEDLGGSRKAARRCPGSDTIPVYRLVNGWFIPDYSFSWTNRESVLDLAYHDCFQCAYLTETRLFQGVFKLRHVPLDCIEIIVVHASCCAPSHATWRAIIYCMICLFSLGD